MKILVMGSTGFIGRNVSESLSNEHEVIRGARNLGEDVDVQVDLEKRQTIHDALVEISPEVVINCAGVVQNNENAKLNEIYTGNLLQEIIDTRIKLGRIVILGSAAEYGIVKPEDIPVDEEVALNPSSEYGEAKVKETTTALEYGQNHNLPVVIARIFNPIGPGMNSRQLIPNVINQIEEIREGSRNQIDVSRLDAKRDYVNIRDVAAALRSIIEGRPSSKIYNVGSGQSTSNGELMNLILDEMGIKDKPVVTETSDQEEPLYAIQADISRLQTELNWQPRHTLKESVGEITRNAK